MRLSPHAITIGALLLATLIPTGCRKAEVRIYDAPKSDTAPRVSMAPAAAEQQAAGGNVVWSKDPAWEELPPTQFRKGNYRLEDAVTGTVEITVSSFPGQVGGLLANINRWLGQAGLPPVTEEQLQKLVTVRQVGPVEVVIADLNADAAEPDATRIYAAILEYGGQSWFFKMSGPKAGVAAQIGNFDEMVDGLRFEGRGMATAGALAAEQKASATDAASQSINFTAPEGWTPSQGSTVRLASYSIVKEGSQPADFAITSFPGDAGGTVANVNRWRKQIGLADWDAAQVSRNLETLTNGSGHTFSIFDLKPDSIEIGGPKTERILVAILDYGGKSWFFKLRGEVFLVETQKPKFKSLLQSVSFGEKSAGAAK